MALTPAQLRELRKAPVGRYGNKLAKAIELSGESQIAIGRAIGQSNTYVHDVSRGRFNTITLDNAYKFATHFGCAIEDLFPSKEAVAS